MMFVLTLVMLAQSFAAGLPHGDSPALHEVPIPIDVDGHLNDWDGIRGFEISETPYAATTAEWKTAPRAWLAFNDDHLYLALQTDDDVIATPERSWRYGDGFYLTVLVEDGSRSSSSHVSFGFGQSDGRLDRVLVNRSGTYFPRVDLSGVRYAVTPRADGESEAVVLDEPTRHEVAVPWRLLSPLDRLLVDSIAINIVVVDRDGDSSRRIVMLESDPHFDTELTSERRGRRLPLLRMKTDDPRPAFTALIPGRRAEVAGGVSVHLATRNLQGTLTLEVIQDGQSVGRVHEAMFGGSGIRRDRVTVPLDMETPTGSALMRATLAQEEADYVVEDSIMILNRVALERTDRELRRVENDDEVGDDVRLSVASALIRLEWLFEHFSSSALNVPIESAVAWAGEAEEMAERLLRGRSAVCTGPGIRRVAHRSAIDGTLQPYSVSLPPGFEPEESARYPVLVALHGSGVDERGTVRSAGARASQRGWIVVAPRARGLSDWYVGDGERDVLEVLDHAASLYGLDARRVYVAGFSMGGYGAYRMAFRHPERFAAAAVLAGATQPPAHVEAASADQLAMEAWAVDAPTIPLLILHGSDDQAVAVEATRAMEQRLQSLRWPHEYHEYDGVGHGSAEWWDTAFDWLDALDAKR